MKAISTFTTAFAILAASVCYGVTPPVLTVSDGIGNSATVDSTGAFTHTGSASALIHTGSSTLVVFGGTVGTFSMPAIACIFDPTSLAMDCSVQGVSTTAAGTLTITWVNSGITVPGGGTVSGGKMQAGGVFSGADTITFSTTVNGGTIATLTFTASPFSGNTVGPASGTFPVTESEIVTLHFAAGALGGGDFELVPVIVPATGGGCPATKGFWKNAKKHPFPDPIDSNGLTIAGVHYSPADLYFILGNPPGGNAVLIMGSQLVAALLNIGAGATHSGAVDAAISSAESLLSVGLPGGPPGVTFPINMTTGSVDASTALGTAMTSAGLFLDGYNSANFETCNEGSGLQFSN